MRTTTSILLVLASTAILSQSKFSFIENQYLGAKKPQTKDLNTTTTMSNMSNMSNSSNSSNGSSNQGTNSSNKMTVWRLTQQNGAISGMVNFGYSNINVGIDVDSPTFILSVPTPGSNISGLYNPMSPSINFLDPLRYKAGSASQVGYFIADQICLNLQPPHNGMSNLCTKSANFKAFGAQFGTSAYSPLNGLIGLGLGNDRYGTNFLTQLAAQFSSQGVQPMWSFYSGPYLNNLTQLVIGGIRSDLMQPVNRSNAQMGMLWHQTNGQSWTINMTDVRYNGTSYFNSSETTQAYFNYQIDNILFPTNTYNKIVARLSSTVTGITCNASASCVVNDVCSTVVRQMSTLSFQFDGMNNFIIPLIHEIVDAANSVQCIIKVGRQTRSGPVVTLGLPFMRAFYTAYHIQNMSIGIAHSAGGQGSLTMTM